MAFPCDVLLVVIAVGIPHPARQCDGIMNQSDASGQTNLRREVGTRPAMPRRNATRVLGMMHRGRVAGDRSIGEDPLSPCAPVRMIEPTCSPRSAAVRRPGRRPFTSSK